MKAKFRHCCDLARCCPDNGHFPRFNFLLKPKSDIDTYENTVASKNRCSPEILLSGCQLGFCIAEGVGKSAPDPSRNSLIRPCRVHGQPFS